MMVAADLLRRKADEYRALGEEHTDAGTERMAYEMIELVLRELAKAVECEETTS